MNRSSNYIKAITNQNSLKTHFKKIEKSYSMDINMAIYLNLQKIQEKKIFEIITAKQDQNFIINFYAFRAILHDSEKDQFYKLFIRDVDQELRKNSGMRKYSIMFFYSPSDSKSPFQILKDTYKKLPAIYFALLTRIYVVQPGFILKSCGIFNFSSWSKLFYSYVEYIQNITALQEKAQLKVYNILCKCPRQITRDIKLVCQPTKASKLNLKSKINLSPISLLKKQFIEYPIDEVRNAPLFLTILIETMKQNQVFCQSVGIFRAAGSIQQEQQLISQINEIQTFRILQTSNTCKNALAGIIKKIFTNSSTPLIPYKIYDQLISEKIDQKNVNTYIKYLIRQLPPLNRRIFLYVLNFLRGQIIDKKQINKMNAHNISVVFTPCFFRSKQCSLSDLVNSGKFAAILKFCLQSDQATWSTYQEFNKSKLTRQHEKEQRFIQN